MSWSIKDLTKARRIITQQRAELAAARALLREVLKDDEETIAELEGIGLKAADGTFALTDRIRNYLDACDTLGESNG